MRKFHERHPLIYVGHEHQAVPTLLQWLLMPSKNLAWLYGVNGKDRASAIGHARALRSAGALTLGLWGGAARPEDIHRAVAGKLTDAKLRSFRYSWGLSFGPDDREPSPVFPCIEVQRVLQDRPEEVTLEDGSVDWRRLGGLVGILPVEAVFYDFIFQHLVIDTDEPPSRLTRLGDDALREVWHSLGYEVSLESLGRKGTFIFQTTSPHHDDKYMRYPKELSHVCLR